MPKLVGMSKATEMAFTGDMIGADEALECGLVSRVVSHDSLMDEAHILEGKIAANPGHTLCMSKKLLREGKMGIPEVQRWRVGATACSRVATTDGRREPTLIVDDHVQEG